MLQTKEYFLKLLMWLVPVSVLGWCVFRFLIPQHAFAAYWLIPVVMLLMGGAYSIMLRRMQGISIKDSFMWFMVNTVFKMIVSVAFIVAYFTINKTSIIPFSLTYVCYYMLLLLFETRWYIREVKSEK